MEILSKRRHNDNNEYINMEFLLNQTILLSESEYKNKLISESYSEYLNKYFQKRITIIFSELRNKIWFRDRYINCESMIQNKEIIESPYFFIIENINYNLSFKEIKNKFYEDSNILKIYIDQSDLHKYSRNLYINLKSNIDMNYLLDYLKFFSKSYYYIFEKKIKIKENYQVPICILKKIFLNFCEKYNLNSEELYKTYENKNKNKFINEIEILVNILRNEFRYCTYCAKMYDNDIVMYKKCIEHKFSINWLRNIEIASIKKDFSNIKFNIKTNILYNNISVNIFKCNICNKQFESEKFILKHLESKHPFDLEKINKKKLDFNCFLKNIDLFIFNIITGCNYIGIFSWISDTSKNDNLPIYDLPLLYSGE